MKDFREKHAVVTGGASGIGLAIVERLIEAGARVVVADVEPGALEAAVEKLRAGGAEVEGVATDVTRFEAVEELAARATERFGPVHLLFNNAGVGCQEDQPLWELPLSDWAWTLSVNLWGVIHGVKAFVPGMLAHGEEAHVVNTSSGNGGLTLIPDTPIYSTSKSAVSTLTEVLHLQLTRIGASVRASVLYPGPHLVTSNIFTAARNRDQRFERGQEQMLPPFTLELVQQMVEAAGLPFETTEPEEVAEHALAGLRDDRFYILPPNEDADARLRERMEGILARKNPELPALPGG